MRYRWFGSRGLFLGSGVARPAEHRRPAPRTAGCTRHRRRDAIIALRCAKASRQRKAVSDTPHTRTNRLTTPGPQDDLGYLQK